MDSLSSEARNSFSHETISEFAPVTHTEPTPLEELTGETVQKISCANSGCLIDMHLKNFILQTRHDYLKPDLSTRITIENAVYARTEQALANPDLPECFAEIWKDWAKNSFGYTLDRIAPRLAVIAVNAPQKRLG